jgi:hypothetical protein
MLASVAANQFIPPVCRDVATVTGANKSIEQQE